MTIRKEVLNLIEELKSLKIGSGRWNTLMGKLKKDYKMPAFNLLALYHNPPTLEYNDENRHLLLEPDPDHHCNYCDFMSSEHKIEDSPCFSCTNLHEDSRPDPDNVIRTLKFKRTT